MIQVSVPCASVGLLLTLNYIQKGLPWGLPALQPYGVSGPGHDSIRDPFYTSDGFGSRFSARAIPLRASIGFVRVLGSVGSDGL